jgi:ABC-type uncharacterized transport system permease subunit
MIVLAHLVAIACYIGAAALAAAPFVRPVAAPVKGVLVALAAGVAAHFVALVGFTHAAGQLPLTGLGPSLSSAGFTLAATLLAAEFIAHEVSLTVVAAPLAAVPTACATLAGMTPGEVTPGMRGVWLGAHIVLSLVGIAAFATAAAAGTMYLVQRRELRSRRFGALFRFFPPLATLDRLNHVSAVAGWLGLTLGVVLAASYSIVYHEVQLPKIVWATGAWIGMTALTMGRVLGGWQSRRAALFSSVAFGAVLVLYVVLRAVEAPTAGFL